MSRTEISNLSHASGSCGFRDPKYYVGVETSFVICKASTATGPSFGNQSMQHHGIEKKGFSIRLQLHLYIKLLPKMLTNAGNRLQDLAISR